MPASRRRFLKQLGALGVVSLGSLPPAFLVRSAAAAGGDSHDPEGRVLVLVELAGGNDGLNTVIPHGDDEYYKARPGIAVPKAAVLHVDDYHGLHPQMQGMKELYDDGLLAVVQGVGYPSPNRSHFRSMDIWHSAHRSGESPRDGWLGRALDETAEQHAGRVPAMALGTDRLPLALRAAKVNVPTVRDPGQFRLPSAPGPENNDSLFRSTLSELLGPADRPGGVRNGGAGFPGAADLEFLRRTTVTALETARKLDAVSGGYRPAVEYPANGLGQKMKTIAEMIAAEMGVRVFFVSLGGFDTHAQQQGAHQALLGELSSAVLAFRRDLEAQGTAERVLLATFSEFGRRTRENGSLGTDHGAASQMFVVTPTGKGGLKGAHPSLIDLDDGDLKHHTDFRSVYATLLSRWLGFPSEPVLGGPFPSLDFV